MAKKDHSFSWIREGDINSRDACARRWKKEQKNLFAAERVLIKSREDIVPSIGEENTKHNIVEEGKRAERALWRRSRTRRPRAARLDPSLRQKRLAQDDSAKKHMRRSASHRTPHCS